MASFKYKTFRRWSESAHSVFRESGPFEKAWNSLYIGVPLWNTGAFYFVRWTFIHIPPPGYAIGALAVVAGLMSVREMKVLGKMFWVFLLLCLLFSEFRAINTDHAESERKQKEFFEKQQEDFGNVTHQAASNFAGTTAGLTTAIGRLQELLSSTKDVEIAVNKNPENVTGGKAFAFVLPDTAIPPDYFKPSLPTFSMTVCNGGHAILSGLGVAIAHVEREGSPTESIMTDAGLNRIIPAGSLRGHSCKKVPGYYMDPRHDDPGGPPSLHDQN
jgi:hypothetical protein